eukprot:15498_1
MFATRYFDGYWAYRYDRNRLWILEQTQDSYWAKNSSVKDYRVKGYVQSNEEDTKIMNAALVQNDMDLLSQFKAQCMNYVDVPMMSHILSLRHYDLSHHLSSQIILSISRCLDIRRQIALNRTSKTILKDTLHRRLLSRKNKISQSELEGISSIVKIGIKSNLAMLNAVSSSKQSNTALLHKILSVLTKLLSALGPLSLKNHPFHALQSLLIEFCSNPNKYQIEIEYPLQALLALTLCQATLHTTIRTINAMFDTVLQSKQPNALKLKVTPSLYDLISKSFAITLEAPNNDLLSDSFRVSFPVPTPFSHRLDSNREPKLTQEDDPKDEKKEKEDEEGEEEKDDEKVDPNQEKKLAEAKRKAIEKRLTDFIAQPTGGAIASYKSYLIYLNDKGLHKIGTGYHDTKQGHIYASIKGICLANDNIAWMTTWIDAKDNRSWILIRFRYDPQKKDDKLSGHIYVIDADTFVLLGEIHQDGEGTIKTENNSKYDSLGRITTAVGPIFVNQQSNCLCALQYEETVDDVCTLKLQQFELPQLKYCDNDLEMHGMAKKKKERVKRKQIEDANAFGWGQNGSGGLGVNDNAAKHTPTPLTLLPKVRLESCFAGNETSFFVTCTGNVYGSGRNGSGQLGLGQSNLSNQMKPQLIKGLSGHRIIKISGSRHGSHTVFLSDKGKVFCAGNNGNGQVKTANEASVGDPYCINDKDEELIKITKKKGKKWLFFVDVAAATNRTAAVTKNGELFCWGNNNRRSMGLESEQSFRHPTLEKRLAEKLEVKLVRIDMGHSFSLCLDSKGDCYAVGDGSYGQLGLGDTSPKTEWTKVPFEGKWKDISCGYYHGMAIAKKKDGSGQVYVWGNNQNGQLGLGSRDRKTEPTPITSFSKNEQISFVQGGGFFSGCLTTNGDVYVWGSNSYGEQGQGDTTTRQQPIKVTTEGFDEHKIRFLAVGYYHCLAIPENRDPPIGRNTLHDMRWYKAPQKIGCLTRYSKGNGNGHQIRIYDQDESRIFTTKEVEYQAKDNEEPMDITYNPYNHSVYAIYAPTSGKDHLVIKRWMNAPHLEWVKDGLAWESEYLITHPDYVLDREDAERDGSSLISVTVNLIACVDLMIKSKLIDPYSEHEEQIEEWKYFYEDADKRSLTLFARCLCIGGDKKVFESLIKSVITSWNTLKKIWILQKSSEYSIQDNALFRVRIYLLIALFRVLSFNVKMFSIKTSSAEEDHVTDKSMKNVGDALFHLLSDVTNTVDDNIESKKGNAIEVQALSVIQTIAQQTFKYAFNVFYASWNDRAQFLITLIEDIKTNTVTDVSFKTIGVQNISKASQLSNLYAVSKKDDQLYEYVKDKKKEEKKEEDDDDEEETATPRHKVIDALLPFIIDSDTRAMNGSKTETRPEVEEIRTFAFKLIRSIQIDINNKVAMNILKSEAKSGNPSKIFTLSLKIIAESNALLTQIMQHKDQDKIINQSQLLGYLLPVAVQSFQPFVKRLEPVKHAQIFETLHALNDKLNQLNKARDGGVEEKKESGNPDDVMVIESDHPYTPTKSKRYVAEFDDTVHAVMIDFDIRCKFRTEDDQLVIGFPENPNYFHGQMTYDVPGTLIVPSNKVFICFASYGSAALRIEDPPNDALQKRWGFRLYLKPQTLARPHHLYSLQMTVCDLLAHIAFLGSKQTHHLELEGKSSLRFPKPAELYSSALLKNGLEPNDDDDDATDDSKQDIEVQSFLRTLLTDDTQQGVMDKVRKEFSTAPATHCVAMGDLKARKDIFATLPSEINIKVCDEQDQVIQLDKTCSIKAQLFKKVERKPREEERDWMKEVSWSQYEAKTMDLKLTQFATCYDGKDSIFIIGGYKEGDIDSKDCYKYSLKDDKYTKIQALDFAVKCHTVRMLGDGRILSMGGNTSHCAIYDPVANKWDYGLNTDDNKKHFGAGSRFVILENKDGEEVAHCIGGSKYVEGDNEEKKDDDKHGGDKHWTYNISKNEWTLMETRCPTKVKYHGLVKDTFNRIYCFGGKPNGQQMHCFDADRDVWHRCPDIPVDVCSFGTSFDGDHRYILLCGGSDTVQPHSGARHNHFYIYDTVNGEWKKSDHNIPTGTKNAECVVIGQKCHLFGGSNGSPLNKHAIGTANIELKEKDQIRCYQHKKANEEWIQLVEKVTTFNVAFDKGKDGVATIQWTPFIHGTYLMDVVIDGQPIQNSPYSIEVQPLADICVTQSNNKDVAFIRDIKDPQHANAFDKPSKALFVYDEADPYTVAFVEYVESITYEWQRTCKTEVEMPSSYNASLSTGVYGVYQLNEVEIIEEKDRREVPMPRDYKASYSSGVYGSYALNAIPLKYCPSYNCGVYGAYMVGAQTYDGYDKMDASDTDHEEEDDTFNALFKEMEKHSTYKKNADAYGNQDNLDTDIMFGGVVPKRWMIDGARVDLKCGPCKTNEEDTKEEKEEEAVSIAPVPLTSVSSYKAMQCVFLTLIKHLGLGDMFYAWSRNDAIDSDKIALMGRVWRYACDIACRIVRGREDFPPQKGEIKTKEMMDYKKKDVKDLLVDFKNKRNEARKGKKEDEEDKKEEEKDKEEDDKDKDKDKEKEDEKKVYKGVCKSFDLDYGFGIIVVDEDQMEVKVDQSEVFGDYGNSTLAVGEQVQFEIIEKDGVKEAICCTGIDGAFVAGVIQKKPEQESEETHDFDGFTRGYTHLHKQCEVLLSIRHSNTQSIATGMDLKENALCKSMESIFSLNQSVDLSEVQMLIRDRTKIALQKERAYHMFCTLFTANDISEALYLMILWYFYQSFYAFGFPTHSAYRNKPEIWDEALEEHIKQRKYALCNKRFKSHYLSDVDGVNTQIVKRLKVLFWDIVQSAITLANTKYPQSIALKNRITNMCCMDWRKDDFAYFKQKVSDSKQSMIEYLCSLSCNSIKIDESITFWKEDIFAKHIFDKEIEARKKTSATKDQGGIIRSELPSLTWFAPMDLDEKLFVADVEDKCMRLNVHTSKKDEAQRAFKLQGQGTCPFIANGVAFEGEYRPYDKDNAKSNINLKIERRTKDVKIELASWSGNDPVKNGFNKSHIKINNGRNKQTTNYGFHFALINLFTGGYAKYKYFDIHSSESNVKPLVEYVADLPANHLIVITTYYSSGKHWKKELYEALKVYGWSWEKVEDYESFIFVANTNATVHYQEKKTKSNGPLKKELTIPLLATPDIQFNGGFVDEHKIEGTWEFVYGSKDEEAAWSKYAEALECKKEKGSMDFTVSKELEDGWKWNETEDMKTVQSQFYSYLRIPQNAYTLEVSSNANTSKNANDKDLETYWQSSSSAKAHWISFQFAEEACFTGIGFYFNFSKDSNYVPEVLKVYIGAENKEDVYCLTTRQIQREFKGVYVVQLDSKEVTKDVDKEDDAESQKMTQNGYIKCKYVKVEWLYETQAKYARVRQVYLYSKKIDEYDDKTRSCMIANDALLSANIWQCRNLLDELEKEYDEEWMKKKQIDQTKPDASVQTDHSKEKKEKSKDKVEIDFGLFDDEDEDEYTDEEEDDF